MRVVGGRTLGCRTRKRMLNKEGRVERFKLHLSNSARSQPHSETRLRASRFGPKRGILLHPGIPIVF
jgi:hypothetical protein